MGKRRDGAAKNLRKNVGPTRSYCLRRDHIFHAVFGTPTETGNAMAMSPSVQAASEISASESATDQLDLKVSGQIVSWQNSFAFEDAFAELTGHLAVPLAIHAVQSARPATSIASAKMSALGSYGRNALTADAVENPKFRAVA